MIEQETDFLGRMLIRHTKDTGIQSLIDLGPQRVLLQTDEKQTRKVENGGAVSFVAL